MNESMGSFISEKEVEELIDSNSSLEKENDSLIQTIESMHQQSLQKIAEQEKQLILLREQNSSLKESNEKLLKLADSEKQLCEENKKLKQEKKILEADILSRDQEIANLKKQITASADDFKKTFENLPTQKAIKDFSDAINNTTDAISKIKFMKYIVIVMIFIFVGSLGILAGGVMEFRADMVKVNNNIQVVKEGIFNQDGWSVFEGTVRNEWVWSQKNPEAYQRYLQEKQQQQH